MPKVKDFTPYTNTEDSSMEYMCIGTKRKIKYHFRNKDIMERLRDKEIPLQLLANTMGASISYVSKLLKLPMTSEQKNEFISYIVNIPSKEERAKAIIDKPIDKAEELPKIENPQDSNVSWKAEYFTLVEMILESTTTHDFIGLKNIVTRKLLGEVMAQCGIELPDINKEEE